MVNLFFENLSTSTSYNYLKYSKIKKMKFNDLSVKDKIRHIKEKYCNIIEEIYSNKEYLDKYIPITSEPILGKNMANDFSIQKNKYEETKKLRNAIENKLLSIKTNNDCMCEPIKCIDVDTNHIEPEFQIFIDFARLIAENEDY